mmetsp:Transcript_65981/g.144718  ORF Transcript_65981/g.144718 Transcript_65981/m.144718 type:complete len:241 (-) Transcript_65981:774-1496(-)
MVSPSVSTSSVLGNHLVLPSLLITPHISGALMSGTLGIREAFFQAMGPRFGVPSREVGLLALGVCKGVIMDAMGVNAAGADFIGPTRWKPRLAPTKGVSSSLSISKFFRVVAFRRTLWLSSLSSNRRLLERVLQDSPVMPAGTSNLYTGSHTRSTRSRGSSSSSRPNKPRKPSNFSSPFSKPNKTDPPVCKGTSNPHWSPSRLSTATATMLKSLRKFVTDARAGSLRSFTRITSFHSAPL